MARGGGRGVGWVRGYYDNYSWKSKDLARAGGVREEKGWGHVIFFSSQR